MRSLALLGLIGSVAMALCSPAAAAETEKKVRTPQNDPSLAARTEWWRDARFGMFIHWGLYAVPAGYYQGKPVGGIGEWIMDRAKIPIPEYEKFAKEFNPTKFNGRQWARLAKDAGMKYMVITSKHHDGFSMFDTAASRYDIVDATPYKRDPMKELAKACKAEGIKFGFYHSIMDWHHPELMGPNVSPAHVDRYVNGQLKPQLRELVTKYDPALLWFDGEWVGWWTEERGHDLERFLRALKPNLVINNRIGKRQLTDGDYETPEQEIPANALASGRLWETCMTINDTWGYKRDDHNWKSTADLTHKLIDIASKGGNFLLNVGPTDTGIIPQPSVDRLRHMGQWMDRNGVGIYGTSQSPYRKHPFNGRCTVKGDTLYVHAFSWPEDGLKLSGLQTPVREAFLLDGKEKVGFRRQHDEDGVPTLVLEKPSRLDPLATVVALRLAGPPQVVNVQPVIRPNAQGVIVLPAFNAEIHGDTARLEGEGMNANIGYWTNAHDSASWNVLIPKTGRYRIEAEYACDPSSDGSMFSVVFPMAPHPDTGVKRSFAVLGEVGSTGGWQTYVKHNMGSVMLAGGGTQTVRVQAEKKPKLAVMNLRAIRLYPEQ
ncbi:MAG: alpha-L-fucosidase [Armatimonadetes bacterium]|nr:alpha-L-fucosidase [Armatimonadota bacterium]